MTTIDAPVAPSNAQPGDLWRDTTTGRVFARVIANGVAVWVEQPTMVHPTVSQSIQRMLAPAELVASATPTCTTSATPPLNPKACDLWFESDSGFLFIYYDDGNSKQWVVTNPGKGGNLGPPGPPGMNWTGPWSNINQYSDDDGVEYQGSSYIALKSNIAVTPGSDPATWDLFAQEGAAGVIQTVTAGSGLTGGGSAATVALAVDTTVIAPLANPHFTGDPQAPTPATTDNDTSLATTAFVRSAISTYSPPPNLSGYAPLASPAFTGVPTAPNAAQNTDTVQLATCHFVNVELGGQLQFYAPLASPALTGTPTVPTPAPGDNTTKIPTTAFVAAAIAALPAPPTALPPNGPAGGALNGSYPNPGLAPSSTNGQVMTTVAGVAAWAAPGGGGSASITVSDTAPASPTAGALWWKSDIGQLFLYYNDGNSSQWVPAAPAPSVQQTTWRMLSRQVVSSAVAQVDITNIPSDINELSFHVGNAVPATNDVGFRIEAFNAAGAIDAGSNYDSNGVLSQSAQAVGAAPVVSAVAGYSAIIPNYNAAGNGIASGANAGISIDGKVLNIKSAATNKMVTFSSYYINGASSAMVSFVGGGRWVTSTGSILTGLRFFFGGANIVSGSFEVWGSP
jgi:hypothetical protein